jgi:hypothetical protein
VAGAIRAQTLLTRIASNRGGGGGRFGAGDTQPVELGVIAAATAGANSALEIRSHLDWE